MFVIVSKEPWACYICARLKVSFIGVLMRQAFNSGISLNATGSAQPVTLGVFDPLHDLVFFGITPANNLKVSFSLLSRFEQLHSVMGKRRVFKPLNLKVVHSHF